MHKILKYFLTSLFLRNFAVFLVYMLLTQSFLYSDLSNSQISKFTQTVKSDHLSPKSFFSFHENSFSSPSYKKLFNLVQNGLVSPFAGTVSKKNRLNRIVSNIRQSMRDINPKIYIGLNLMLNVGISVFFASIVNWEHTQLLIGIVHVGFIFIMSTKIVDLVFGKLFTLASPLILPEVNIGERVPEKMKTVSYFPVLLNSADEVTEFENSLRKSISSNDDPNIKWTVFSTSPDGIRELEVELVKKLQAEYGADRVFYIHRDKSVNNWEKKRGGYIHFMLWLKNSLNSSGEIGEDPRFPTAPTGKVFDEILGDINALKDVKNLMMSDSDSIWTDGAVKKLISKIEHPDNGDYTIFQGLVKSINVEDTVYTKSREFFIRLGEASKDSTWKALKQTNFIGHGAGWNVDKFLDNLGVIMKDGFISHDLVESYFAKTALVTDVTTFEDVPENFVLQVKQWARWWMGNKLTFVLYRNKIEGSDGKLYKNTATIVDKFVLYLNSSRYLFTFAAGLFAFFKIMTLGSYTIAFIKGLLPAIFIGSVLSALLGAFFFVDREAIKKTSKYDAFKGIGTSVFLAPVLGAKTFLFMVDSLLSDIRNKLLKTESNLRWTPQGSLSKELTFKDSFSWSLPLVLLGGGALSFGLLSGGIMSLLYYTPFLLPLVFTSVITYFFAKPVEGKSDIAGDSLLAVENKKAQIMDMVHSLKREGATATKIISVIAPHIDVLRGGSIVVGDTFLKEVAVVILATKNIYQLDDSARATSVNTFMQSA